MNVPKAKKVWEARNLENDGLEICFALYKQIYLHKLREKWRLYLPKWPPPDVWLEQCRWHVVMPKLSELAQQVTAEDLATMDPDTQVEIALHRRDDFPH